MVTPSEEENEGTTPTPPTVAVSKKALVWVPTGNSLEGVAPDAVRETVSRVASSLIGLGAKDKPRGRANDYFEAIGHGESTAFRNSYVPTKVLDPDDWRASCCGLVVRRIWAACGLEDPALLPPYRPASVMVELRRIALTQGAWRCSGRPAVGDAVFLTPAHVFTISRIEANVYVSTDGGQIGGNGGGTEISEQRREIFTQNGQLYVRNCKSTKTKAIDGWADVAALNWTGVVYLPTYS